MRVFSIRCFLIIILTSNIQEIIFKISSQIRSCFMYEDMKMNNILQTGGKSNGNMASKAKNVVVFLVTSGLTISVHYHMALHRLGEASTFPALVYFLYWRMFLSVQGLSRNYGSKFLNHPELYFSLFHCSCCFSFFFQHNFQFPLATVLCPPLVRIVR